jgi:hypothetical protein
MGSISEEPNPLGRTPERVSPNIFDSSVVKAVLVIGVTGHRDIPKFAQDGLQQKIKEVFLELKAKYKATPFVLITPLAEGADRLCAYCALSEDVQIDLFVPLPMPREIYEKDFDGDSLGEFRKLLSRAKKTIELPLVEGNTVQGISQKGPQRDLQYESAGKYIAQKSQILIALWDGTETGLTGGTASVVHFQREGIPVLQPCSLEPPEGFPVCHILTPREGQAVQQEPKANWLYPSAFGTERETAAAYFDRIFSRINDLNKYAAAPDQSLTEEIREVKRRFAPGLSEQELPEVCKAVLDRYAVVDSLAIRFRGERIRAQVDLHWLIFLSFVSFVLFAHLSGHSLVFLAVSVLLLIAAYYRRAMVKRTGADTKYEDYRSLAEGLRVEFFWRWVGLKDSVTDYYLWKQRTELDWMRNVFRGWGIRGEASGQSPTDSGVNQALENVSKFWIEAQRTYFTSAQKREAKHVEKLELYSRYAVRSAITVGVVVLLLRLYEWSASRTLNFCSCDWVDYCLIFIEAALAAGALVHHFRERMAYVEHAKQYGSMARMFTRASTSLQQLQTKKDTKGAVSCLKKIGIEALAENGGWVMLHRERPLEMPHP